MISGRGLGHTGGTLDKLESIPGFNTSPGQKEFQRLVRRNGLSIIGQTHKLAPADARIYAVRDVTGTVASTPLIVSSILSKKLAEGLDALVMDIKVGNGAFMESQDAAEQLARVICQTAHASGLACDSILTDMSQPISWSAGNALEMREACAYLSGEKRHPRLHAIVLAMASQMLLLGDLADSGQDAVKRLEQVLANGQAAEKFARMVADQGGPSDFLEHSERHLASAAWSQALKLDREGWISGFNMSRLGMAVVQLGGGRLREEDGVDHAVGLSGLRSIGEFVEHGEELITIHARSKSEWLHAATHCLAAIELSDLAPVQHDHSVVLGQIR
jgi:thymidine phosphorylase